MASNCCLCNSRERVRWCKLCEHNFCGKCRRDFFARGKAFLDFMLGRNPLYCDHEVN